MTQIWWLDVSARVVSVATLVLSLVFIVQYTVYSPWWRDQVGRTIVIEAAGIFLAVLFPTVEEFVTPTRTEQEVISWVSIGTVACIAVTLLWRIIVWHRIRNELKKH